MPTALQTARLALGYPYAAIRRLIGVVGQAAAKDLKFTARRIDAEEAWRIGLVQTLAEAEDLEDLVGDYAAGIAANAPLTVRAMKLIANEVLKDSAARDLELCDRLVADCFASNDYKEGRRAFMEKRDPEFTGC